MEGERSCVTEDAFEVGPEPVNDQVISIPSGIISQAVDPPLLSLNTMLAQVVLQKLGGIANGLRLGKGKEPTLGGRYLAQG
jgi:hypothetical protein